MPKPIDKPDAGPLGPPIRPEPPKPAEPPWQEMPGTGYMKRIGADGKLEVMRKS